MTEEQDLAALSFKAAAHDLELIVRHIAGRYIHQRVPLTWRLLHAIEAEALADLGFASRHDAGMRQGVRDREPGDAGADDEHTFDRTRESRRHLCTAVVEGHRHDTTAPVSGLRRRRVVGVGHRGVVSAAGVSGTGLRHR